MISNELGELLFNNTGRGIFDSENGHTFAEVGNQSSLVIITKVICYISIKINQFK